MGGWVGYLGEELGHDLIGRDSRSDGVGVLPVVRVLDISFLDGVGDEGGDGFLPVVEVHEAAGWVGGWVSG